VPTYAFTDHLLSGDHASRPAASATPQGALYACDDHPLIYKSDGVSAWSTYAALGGDFLSSGKAAATPDDEFDSGTLDPKWTVVSGGSGTVSLTESGNVAKYDLTTRPGWCLFQVGAAATQEVLLRQDYTLPDGASLGLAVAAAVHLGTPTADELQIGISLNTDDATFLGASCLQFYAVEMDGAAEIQAVSTGSTGGAASTTIAAATHGISPLARIVYVRITRDGLWYYPHFSFDGYTWMPLGASSFAAEFTNIWLFARNAGATGTPVPIQAVAWLREGSDAFDPWAWA